MLFVHLALIKPHTMKALLLIFSFWAGASLICAQPVTLVGGSGYGSALNQLSSPEGLCLDNAGNVYVADAGNSRIIKFLRGSTDTTNGIVVAGGNGRGAALNQIGNAQRVFVDIAGDIYVADADNSRIMKFPPNSTSNTYGVIVAGGNGRGSALNQLSAPDGIFVDANGYLYVSEIDNNRVLKFPPNSTSASIGTIAAGGNGVGDSSNQLAEPGGIFVDNSGSLFVADFNNNRIQKFPPGSTVTSSGVTVAGGMGYGDSLYTLTDPVDVYLDDVGNIYVADEFNARVLRFPPNSTAGTRGVVVAGGNGPGYNINQLYYPTGVRIDPAGYVYTADFWGDRVQKWGAGNTSSISTAAIDNFKLYPNPNAGTFVLETSGCIEKAFSVCDAIGRIIAAGIISSDRQQIEVGVLSAGQYTMMIKGSAGTSLRFIVYP